MPKKGGNITYRRLSDGASKKWEVHTAFASAPLSLFSQYFCYKLLLAFGSAGSIITFAIFFLFDGFPFQNLLVVCSLFCLLALKIKSSLLCFLGRVKKIPFLMKQ